MCGISGIVSPGAISARYIALMGDLIRHRGPDDEGFILYREGGMPPLACGGPDTPGSAYDADMAYRPTAKVEKHAADQVCVAMGHRRLSVIDLSSLGHQPLCIQDGRYWIVYNGEIYNYRELRSELEAAGHRFVSATDTEVVVAAYATWGRECLQRLRGMWAFAILDMTRQELFLARDRFGIKPLYYWKSADGVFAFASEIKQFTALPGWNPTANPQRSYDFLTFGISDHTEQTLFRDVMQIPPGGAMVVGGLCQSASPRPLSIRMFRWYELAAKPFRGTYQEACDQLRARFFDAVKLHLRSDVPIGSCLSGGLDSSSIVCVASRLLGAKGQSSMQRTFSAYSDVSEVDERRWVELVIGATGVVGKAVYPTVDGLLQAAPGMTWHQDEPFGSTSIYAQWSVFEAVHEAGVKVMLDGQGSDEQFAGYHTFFGPHLASHLRNLHLRKLIQEAIAIRRMHGYALVRSLSNAVGALLPGALRNSAKRALGLTHASPSWLHCKRLGCVASIPEAVRLAAGATSVYELSRAQLTSSNLQMLLHWEDRNSMAFSIESRVPFLDHELVEFVVGLPDAYKLANGVTKRVLRDAMSDLLPSATRDRIDKVGFATPEETWVRERAPRQFMAQMDEAIASSGGVLRGDEVRMMAADMLNGRRPYGSVFWRLISFGTWLRLYSVKI